MNRIDRIGDKSHTLTREDRINGGKTLTPRKYKSLQLNPLKTGKKSLVLSNATERCDGCKYITTCSWYEKGAICQIFIKQVKAINRLGLNFNLTEIAITYIMSLQRFARKMMETNTQNEKSLLEIERYEKEIKELQEERKILTESILINTNKQERLQMREIIMFHRHSIKSNEIRYVQMEKDYMSKINEFKKMVLGDKVTIEANIKVNNIVQEMEVAYALFNKGDESPDFIVNEDKQDTA